MRAYLEQDAFIFSGLKTHTQLAEARSYLKDEKGNLRPYYDFEQKVLKLNQQYNRHYLEAEYEFAAHSAMSAANWANLQEDTGRYWLEYRTAGDERVRASHQQLNGICLPKTDTFWTEYYPPNGWRCRCVAVEVLAREKTPSDSQKAQELGQYATSQIGKNGKNKLAMFRFNPGQQKKMFPPNNSYNPKFCNNGKTTLNLDNNNILLSLEDERCKAKQIIEEKAKRWYRNKVFTKPREKQFSKIKDNVYEHILTKRADDYVEIKQSALLLSENKKRTEIMPEINAKERSVRQIVFAHLSKLYKSNPDIRNGNKYYDLKRPKAIKNILGNANKASKQGAIAIISDSHLNKPLTEDIIKERVKDIFNSEDYKMDVVIFKVGDKLHYFNRTGGK
ncbi:phage minor head protein [Riemerella anatipestifer]|uniref:phage minor head protein n=1 Tax=Riemerella anatipestifer TaxID=34085 RepID=UPI0011B1F6DD|nr:phage minor head protein [Riemerella anatipestifer]